MGSSLPGVLLTVAYDGTPFHGFAVQPSTRTVAGELLGAIQSLDPHVKSVRGVSRTDAGVHARGQLVAFDPETLIPTRGWVLGLAAHLPPEISIRRAVHVPPGFDPRGHVRGKHYRYTLLLDVRRDPFFRTVCWRIGAPLDLARAAAAARSVIGTHDFRAFRSSSDQRTSTVRTLTDVRIERTAHDCRLVRMDVFGDAFLHNMVRILVGSLCDIARGTLSSDALVRALASGKREDLGCTAPPQGLCLEAVELNLPLDEPSAWPPPGAQDHEASNQSSCNRPPPEGAKPS